ncbi:hypothetical protein GCM10022381_02460 [Leifsonia kafniensis]|uniref:Uncharacterized protein n=1 Tax=Leifsonia kafniensis TaxID=475957 RepID=A0ABP7K1T3_9MICO
MPKSLRLTVANTAAASFRASPAELSVMSDIGIPSTGTEPLRSAASYDRIARLFVTDCHKIAPDPVIADVTLLAELQRER